MSRLQTVFHGLAGRRAALVTFVTGGDPSLAATAPLLHALVAGGADILEVGIPFSDPMADGPTIQRSHQRALAGGATVRGVLEQVAAFRRTDAVTPIVLMGYVNPIEAMGYAAFAGACAGAGVDGVIVVDLPPEEADDWRPVAAAAHVDAVFLLAPTSSPARIARISAASSGFVYYVALKGVTGATHLDSADVKTHLAAIRAQTALPVGVGFGIRDAASATRIGAIADAVIVGSAIVECIGRAAGVVPALAAARALVAELRQALPVYTGSS
ncbi:MAG: tryptophan synthase subunit alpha [Acidiferrobacter sp.]